MEEPLNKEDSLEFDSNVSCNLDSEANLNNDIENDQLTDVKKPKDSTFFNTLMNLLNSLLGAGILSVPSSFDSAGIVPSLIIIIAICFLSYFASIIDVRLTQKIECSGFDELVYKVMGKWGSISYSIIVIIFLFASMIAYLIIGGDMIISWFSFAGIDISPFKYRVSMILIYSLIIPVALMIPKNFFLIGIFSTTSVFFVIFYIIATFIKFVQYFPSHGISRTMVIAKFDKSIFSAIGVYALTFALPTVVIPLLQPYSPEYVNRRNAVMACFIITGSLTIFPSIFLYLMFGSESEGNILNSFPSNDILFTIVRVGFFLIVSFSFPVLGKSVMCNWSQLIFKTNHANDLSGLKYIIIFAITAFIPILVAMFLPQCKPAIAVGGALGGCLSCYTYPALCWVMSSDKKWTDKSNIGYIIFAGFGVILALISTYQSVVDAINAFKDIHF